MSFFTAKNIKQRFCILIVNVIYFQHLCCQQKILFLDISLALTNNSQSFQGILLKQKYYVLRNKTAQGYIKKTLFYILFPHLISVLLIIIQ